MNSNTHLHLIRIYNSKVRIKLIVPELYSYRNIFHLGTIYYTRGKTKQRNSDIKALLYLLLFNVITFFSSLTSCDYLLL